MITLLRSWNVLTVRNGRPSLVRPPADTAASSVGPAGAADHLAAARADRGERSQPARRQVLTLELVHLGRHVRRLRTQADPDDFDALQRLMVDAVHRAGGDPSRIGEYEMNVHLADDAEPVATVVVAA